MSAWRVAARLARRQARRRPGRAALIAGLIGLPVAATVAGSVVARSAEVRPEQLARWTAGSADVVLVAVADPGAGDVVEATDALLASLPPGTRTVVSRSRSDIVRRPGGRYSDVEVRDLRVDDQLVQGVRELRAGRAPAAPGEVAVSPAVLRAAGGGLGDDVELGGEVRRVTGVVVDPGALHARVAVVAGPLDPRRPGTVTRVHADLPGLAGGDAPPRSGVGQPPFMQEFTGAVIAQEAPRTPAVRLLGGAVLVVAAVVAAAAFAVSSRRRLRELGLLGAAGAAPHHLARVMVVEGLLLGGLGAAAGVVLGLAGVAGIAPHLDGIAGHVTGGPRISLAEIAVIGAGGVVAATVAAWMQARTAHWLPVLAALAGRRPLGRVPRHVPAVGAALMMAGLALLVWVGALSFGADLWQFSLAGGVAVLLGAVVLTPWIVAALERAGGRARGSLRLAVRALARQRIPSAAVVSAVMAAAAMATTASAVLLADDAERATSMRPVLAPDQVVLHAFERRGSRFVERPLEVPDAAVDVVAGLLPGSRRAVLQQLVPATSAEGADPARSWWATLDVAIEGAPVDGPASLTRFWLAGPELLDVLAAPPRVAEALRSADAVVLGPRAGGLRRATLRGPGLDPVPMSVTVLQGPPSASGSVLVRPDRVAALGLVPVPGGVMFRSPRPLTDDQRQSLDALAADRFSAFAAPGRSVLVGHQPPLGRSGKARGLVLGVAGLFTLGVVVLGLALVGSESRHDDALLHALGASPRTATRVRAAQAATLGGLGGLLGVPAGFVPTATLLLGSGQRTVGFPTAAALTVAVAIPAAVALAVLVHGRLAGHRPAGLALLADD